MNNTKLTLSIDETVIKQAKNYARRTGSSVSSIVEAYLKTISEQDIKHDVSPEVDKLRGVIQLPKNGADKELISEYLTDRHLK